MTEGPYFTSARVSPRGSGLDPYAAFEEIFGQEPPPGRMSQRFSQVLRRKQTESYEDLRRGASSASLAQRKQSSESLSGQSMQRSVSHVFSSAMRRRPKTQEQQTATTRGGRVIPHRQETLGLHEEPVAPMSRKASTSTISSMSTLQRSTIITTSRKEPLVYPALLSKVAQKLRERQVLSDHIKNELSYKNSFTGHNAVDSIAYIIKTQDRNLALLLGRALDAQKYFHDVTYDNRLRDSQNEIYQFDDDTKQVNGVFTLLADCYSPTCTRDKLCYSISCPRRLEQQARLNMKPDPGLNEQPFSLPTIEDEKQKLWTHMVSPEIAESVSKEEQKRQEAICELIYTERDFVKDLEYLRDFWIKPLRRSTTIIPESRKEKFISSMFLNVLEIHANNIKFAEALTRRQQLSPIVHEIADVVLDYAKSFEPFVRYGAAQRYGKHEFEREKSHNPAFAKFVEETERLPESRNLEINGYLSKPTTRLARYPLLLGAILKKTEPDNPDHKNIPEAIAKIREFLVDLNHESGRTENRFALAQLNRSLAFRFGEYVDLKLTDENRKLVYEGDMSKRPGENDLHAYLFDHAILFVKNKATGKRDVQKVNSKPIPLELLRIRADDSPYVNKASSSSLNASTSSFRKTSSNNRKPDTYPITFQHIGRRGGEITVYAPTFQARRSWIDEIHRQQDELKRKGDVYTQHVLQEGFFGTGVVPHLTCAQPFDGGRKLLYGNPHGIYLSDIVYEEGKRIPHATKPELVVAMPNITQIDVLEVYGTVLFLSDKTIHSLSLDYLEERDAHANTRRAKHIASQCSFYEVAECAGRTLLTVVKSSSLSSNIRVLEPSDVRTLQQKRPPLRRLLSSNQAAQAEGFKLFKPAVDVPSSMISVSYLRSHLCLGCSKGFELLDLNTLKIEELLDPADTSLDFVIKRDSLRPISIYRINKEFLLNYSDFSFFINGNGWRSKPNWIIQWESSPKQIVLCYPYLIGFESGFIEIRTMNTDLLCAIPGENIRFLHESTHEILYAVDDERGGDKIISLNFWEKQKKLAAVEQ